MPKIYKYIKENMKQLYCRKKNGGNATGNLRTTMATNGIKTIVLV